MAFCGAEMGWGFSLSLVSMYQILPVMIAALGGNHQEIALVPALTAVMAGLPQFFSHRLLRHRSIRSVVLFLLLFSPLPMIALGTWMVATMELSSLLHIRSLIIVVWSVFFLCLGLLYPLWMDYMSRCLDPARWGRALGIVFFLQTLGSMIGASVASQLLSWTDPPSLRYGRLFLGLGLGCFGGSLFFFLSHPLGTESRHQDDSGGDSIWFWMKQKGFFRLILARLCSRFFPVVVSFYAVWARESSGIDESQTALYAVAMGGGIMVGNLIFGSMGDRFGFGLSLRLSLGCLLLAHLALLWNPGTWIFWPISILCGLYMSMEMQGFGNLVLDLSGTKAATRPLALLSALTMPPMALALWFSGYAMDYFGYLPVVAVSALFITLAIPLMPSPLRKTARITSTA